MSTIPTSDQTPLGKILPYPWEETISRRAPITMRDALYWCEYIALANQTLASALRKLVAFFVTDIEVLGTGRDEQKKIKDYLYNVLNIENVLNIIGLDYLVYGNVFVTIWQPTYKVVTCKSCGFHTPFYNYALDPEHKYAYKNFEIHLKCERCGYEGLWDCVELLNRSEDALSILRWNVHDMQIAYDFFTNRREFLYKIPGEYVSVIQSGSPLAVDSTPKEFIEAIKTGQEFRFAKDKIIHLYEPALGGIRAYGWGLSPIISNFRQTFYIEVLRRANQEICMDYIIPLRIIAPEPRASIPEYGDPNLITNMSNTIGNLSSIIKSWRSDPTGWYACPFPIRYQVLGAEGQRIIPEPILRQANMDLIASLGMPVEFYNGSLTNQAAPVALRLLEGTWTSISKLLNTFLRSLASTISRTYSWDKFELKLQKPSIADDINKQMAKLQLAMSGVISQTTGLQSIGLSQEEEISRKVEEMEMQAEKEQELQERMEAKSLTDMLSTPQEQLLSGMGMPVGPGAQAPQQAQPAPSPTSLSGPPPTDPISAILASIPDTKTGQISLDSLMSASEQIAQQLFGMHPSMRISTLRKIQQKNEVVHALVTRKLDELYNNAALQGKIMAQQQAAQQSSMPM